MEKLFSYAMLVMSMFVFTACPSDDDDDENNSKPNAQTVVKPGVFGNQRVRAVPRFSYSYRSDGSVEQVRERYSNYYFSEDGKTISSEHGDGLHTWDLTYNAQGLVSSIAYSHPKKHFYSYTAILTYDKKNRLQKIKGASYGGEGEIELFWEDDCIVAGGFGADITGASSDGYRSFNTFTYSNKKYVNKHRQYSPAEADMLSDDVYRLLAHLGLLGVGSAYYPETYTWNLKQENSSEPHGTLHKVSYTFNEEGLIKQFFNESSGGSSIDIYTYESKFY